MTTHPQNVHSPPQSKPRRSRQAAHTRVNHSSTTSSRIKGDRSAPPFNLVAALISSAVILGAVGLLGSITDRWQTQAPPLPHTCSSTPRPHQALSRETLLQLLAIPERQEASTVRQLLSEPYCQLPAIEIRAGVSAERSLYTLEFDPKTWLVILYEEEEYAGYAFDIQP